MELEISLGAQRGGSTPSRVCGLVYVAHPENENYLGPAPIEAIAAQIVRAQGPSGENPEYVFELAKSLRGMGADDAHVFSLEAAVEGLLAAGSRSRRT